MFCICNENDIFISNASATYKPLIQMFKNNMWFAHSRAVLEVSRQKMSCVPVR